ncbi:hypothetical protein N9L68_06115 [bacterium]|nr:hypothetical protein [bacterium]
MSDRIELDTSNRRATIAASEKPRRWRHALNLLWDMRRFWLHWDVVSCGAAISVGD